jgi:hypothetical protein
MEERALGRIAPPIYRLINLILPTHITDSSILSQTGLIPLWQQSQDNSFDPKISNSFFYSHRACIHSHTN